MGGYGEGIIDLPLGSVLIWYWLERRHTNPIQMDYEPQYTCTWEIYVRTL